jgi:hypothetical protein
MAALPIVTGNFDQVRSAWEEFAKHADEQKGETLWAEAASDVLTLLAKAGQWSLARELITSSNLDEHLFPLTRALDYLLKGDETSIEKLSPEVRRIVDEIVSTLKNISAENRKPRRKLKSKKASTKRKSKKKNEQ